MNATGGDAPPVQTDGLQRRYGDRLALADLTLTVRRGEILGLLGPNGAGKTTLLRIVLGLLRPSAGRCLLFGLPPQRPAARARVGYLPGELSLDAGLTADAMLRLLERLRGRAAVDPHERQRLCDALLLSRADRRRRLRELSRGTRQKVGLLAALQHDPELLVLDEPTEGLDPLVREAVFALLAALRGRGRTVFLSSHVLSEVERVADRVAILRDGRLVTVQDVDALRASLTRRMVVAFARPVASAELQLPGVTVLSQRDGRFELAVAGDLDPLLAVLARHSVRHLAFPEPDLDEAFVQHYRAAAGRPS